MKHSQAWKKRGQIWSRWAIRVRSDLIGYEWYKQTFDPKEEYALGIALFANSGDILDSQTLPHFESRLLGTLALYIPIPYLKKVSFGIDIEHDLITGGFYPVLTATYKHSERTT